MFINPSTLPVPDFIQPVNFESRLAKLKALVLQIAAEKDANLAAQLAGIIDLESEPLNIENQTVAYQLMLLVQQFNENALGTTLAFAQNTDLDAIAANHGLTRWIVQEADNNAVPVIPQILESDDNLRERCWSEMDKKTTAGSVESYRALAKSAHPKIKDIKVISPKECIVHIFVLSCDDDGGATPEILSAVEKAVNAETQRPVADRVFVYSVEVIHYHIDIKLASESQPEIEPIMVASNASLVEFTTQSNRIGETVYLSAINDAAFIAGVKNILIDFPEADMVLAANQIGFCDSINIEKMQD